MVLAGVLARFQRVALDVEDVVLDLEGQAQRLAVLVERIDRIADRSMELLGGEAQQTVLQILARRPER